MPPKQSQQEREADEIEEQREIEEAARTLLAFVVSFSSVLPV